jgi:hypothetical protein
VTSPIWIVLWITLVAQIGWIAWLARHWSQQIADELKAQSAETSPTS